MSDAERPHGALRPSEEPFDRTPKARPHREAGPHREPPSYDAERKGYTGISAGVLGDAGDVRDARAFAEMIVDTIREGLLVLGFDLRVRAANQSFYQMFEVEPEETMGRLVYELGDGQWDIPELRELLEDVLPRSQAFDDYEVEHTFEGIGHRVILLNARRMNDHELVLLAIEDVTERRRGERELRELNEELEARVEERTRQVRGLSRSLALAEQEERRRIAYVLHDDLQQVLAGALMAAGDPERTRVLIDNAINLTRSLSHELSPPLLQGEDLGDLLDWLAERKRELYGLEIDVEVRGHGLMPETDLRILVYQILRELLFNVVKHAGTKRVRVMAERTNHQVRVVVKDEGAGFDPALLEEAGNVGLGLPSVRERLGLVGGSLDVRSTPGRGTRVTIEVPVDGLGTEPR